jgi:uncharacterized membrane protein YhdT
MIISLIFFIHLLFSLIIFTIKWQEEKLSSAFLNVGLIAILFAVGWSIASIIAKTLMEPKGLGTHFDMDTFALTLLTIGEYFFYRMYYKPISTTEADKEKQ